MTSWKDPFVRAQALQPAYIAEGEGLHPDVYFKFAVLDPVELESRNKRFNEIKSKQSPEESIGFVREQVRELVKEWSFKPNPDAESIGMLRSALLMRIFWIVMQTDPTDRIPDRFESESVGDVVKK